MGTGRVSSLQVDREGALWAATDGGLSRIKDGRVTTMTSNNGVGFPTEKAERIFDAFFTTKPQGSGMGLAISRSIVEPHGGCLWATPNDGRGASFHITLPTATDAAEAAASRT
jgi:signal transduction histidine kinase